MGKNTFDPNADIPDLSGKTYIVTGRSAGIGYGICALLLLLKTPDSRIVLQSSELHRGAPSSTQFKDLAELNQDIGPMLLYNHSKLAQILLVRGLHKRKGLGLLGPKAGEAPWINATHPGAEPTYQQEQAVEAYGTLVKVRVKAMRPFMKGPLDEGCRPALFAATSAEIESEKIDDAYIVPDCEVTEVSKQGRDEKLLENLWELVESVLKEKLGDSPYETTGRL